MICSHEIEINARGDNCIDCLPVYLHGQVSPKLIDRGIGPPTALYAFLSERKRQSFRFSDSRRRIRIISHTSSAPVWFHILTEEFSFLVRLRYADVVSLGLC